MECSGHGLLARAGRSPWPVLIDVVEWLARETASYSLLEVLELLCPPPTDLAAANVETPPGPDDLVEQADAIAGGDFLIRHLAGQIASSIGAVPMSVDFGDVDLLSQADFTFAVRLTRAAMTERTLLRVLLRAGPRTGERLLSNGLPIAAQFDMTERLAFHDLSPGLCELALSPRGLPEDYLSSDVPRDLVQAFTGPDGRSWLLLSPHISADPQPSDESLRTETIRRLLSTLPTDGWWPVRRLGLLSTISCGWQEGLDGLGAAFFSLSTGWRSSYLHDYVRNLVAAGLSEASDPNDIDRLVETSLLLARLASGTEAEMVAVETLLAIRERVQSPLQCLRLNLEAGNIFARQRDPISLDKARRALHAGVRGTQVIAHNRRAIYLAHILNTLALVRYHQKRDRAALRLERMAVRIAKGSEDEATRVWADTALGLNMAKLLERRFGDVDGALDELAGSRRSQNLAVRSKASLEMARLHARRENWAACFALIDEELSGDGAGALGSADELWARLFGFVAATKSERPRAAELYRESAVRLARALGVAELERALQSHSGAMNSLPY